MSCWRQFMVRNRQFLNNLARVCLLDVRAEVLYIKSIIAINDEQNYAFGLRRPSR